MQIEKKKQEKQRKVALKRRKQNDEIKGGKGEMR